MALTASPAHILVVEDDPTVSEVVTRYLEREGFVVEVAYDGADGLERALAGPPEDNSIRHTPRGGTVWVEAGPGDDRSTAVVSVRDACGGIPSRVFELAYRGDAARTPSDGGAGLGLAVARGLVEAHHGEVSVRNEGQGCRFTIRLPLARS